MSQLSTHVLDTARGVPAAGVRLELWRLDGDERTHLASFTTNADGRTDEPLLVGEAFRVGVYELVFAAGAYFRAQAPLPEPPFLDAIVVRFGVSDPSARLHVPLLVSPYGYSTYRGS